MRTLFGAAGLVAVLVGGAAGQAPHTFKEYDYKVGDKTRTTKTEDATTASTFTATGNEQKTNEKKKKTLVYVTEVLEVGPDATKPAKVKRTYEKAVEEKDGAETKLPLHGKTVTITRSGEKYTFAWDAGTPVAPAALAELEREFAKKGSFGDKLFPEKGVKAGDTWDLTEKFVKEVEGPDNPFVLAEKGAVVTGKLVSAAKKGATTFGDIEVTGDLPLTELRGKLPLKLNPGSTWKLAMKGTGALDGSTPEGNSTATMSIKLDGTTQGVAVKITSEQKMSSRTERVGAK